MCAYVVNSCHQDGVLFNSRRIKHDRQHAPALSRLAHEACQGLADAVEHQQLRYVHAHQHGGRVEHRPAVCLLSSIDCCGGFGSSSRVASRVRVRPSDSCSPLLAAPWPLVSAAAPEMTALAVANMSWMLMSMPAVKGMRQLMN